MRTLDRYIIRNFLTAAALWFVVFMALRIVTDLFINMDEFAKQDDPFIVLAGRIFIYYSYNFFLYFTELGGVIIVAAAAFSLARMNHTNELTAMLASGVSLHRVTWPIVLCSMLLGGLIILDQELVIPNVAHKLVRDRDDVPGTSSFPVRLFTDGEGMVWFSPNFYPAKKQMDSPIVLIRDKEYRPVARISGSYAVPAQSIGRGGWLIYDPVIAPLSGQDGTVWLNAPGMRQILTGRKITVAGKEEDEKTTEIRVWTQIGPLVLLKDAGRNVSGGEAVPNPELKDPDYGMTLAAKLFRPDSPRAGKVRGGILIEPRFTFTSAEGQLLGVFLADSARWVSHGPTDSYWLLEKGVLYYPSDLTAEELSLRQSSRWLEYMSIGQLTRLLHMKKVPDPGAAMLMRHIRVTDPINNLVMLLLGLPFILSRERNIKASASLCLLMVATFYVFIYICRYIGLSPALAAWLPILIFGPVAVVMLDSIKT